MKGEVQAIPIYFRDHIRSQIPLINLDEALQKPQTQIVVHFMSLPFNFILLNDLSL
jgi:hypothetical protein